MGKRGGYGFLFCLFLTGGIMATSIALAAGPWIHLPEDPMKGRQVFEEKGCIRCHAIEGVGGKMGPDLGRRPYYGSFLQLAGILWDHSPQMSKKMREVQVPWPTFTKDEMADLVSYLYSLRYTGPPGDPSMGKRLLEKKGCLKCHLVEGRGGSLGPRLDVMDRNPSSLFLVQAMWNHGPEMEFRMQALGLAWPKLDGPELAHVLAYLRTASPRAPLREAALGNPARGEQLFGDKGCSGCHAIRGGGGGVGPDLGGVELDRSAVEITGRLWNHGPPMWAKMDEMGIPYPKFSGEEMADLLAYLYFLRFIGEPGDPEEGEKLFSTKGCRSCHAIQGRGGRVGPDLARTKWGSSPIEMAQAMWNHVPLMEKKVKERKLLWPRFQGREMEDLFMYLESVKARPRR